MTTETERQAWADALADLFSSPPGPSPTLLSVGAQPGAGKTRAIASTRRMFYPGHDFVEILGDDLRQYHPDYERLVADPDPEAMPAATADLSGWLVGQALDHAAGHGYSVLVEGTLRRPETTLGTIEQFSRAGALTHLVVLGVPEAVSWVGCVDRYLTALETGGAARWTPQAAHDAGYTGTPATLVAAEASRAVSRLSVVGRDGALAYDNIRDLSGRWTRPVGAVAALEALRDDPSQALDVSERIGSLRALARRLHAPVQVTAGLDHARALTGTQARPRPGPHRWSSGQERAPGSATGHPGSARPPKPA